MSAIIREDKLVEALKLVEEEFRSACAHNDAFHSAHEGYGVMLEEVDELWDEIKKKKRLRSDDAMRDECKQIAAMAVRFVHDLL